MMPVDEVDALWKAALKAWPGVTLDRQTFGRHLARHQGAPAHASDVYLACACLHGDRRALEHFEKRFMLEVGAFVAAIDASPEFAQEVRQQVLRALFVAEAGATPKIDQYAGTAALGGWLRVVSIRIARNLRRRRKPQVALDSDDGLALVESAPNPELALLKERYRREFREAFQAALAGLGPKEKNLVSLYFLEGLSSAAIGRSYGVHGATVRLWIKQCRETLSDETTRYLTRRLKIPAAELQSVLGLVHSQLDFTVSRLLKDPPPK